MPLVDFSAFETAMENAKLKMTEYQNTLNKYSELESTVNIVKERLNIAIAEAETVKPQLESLKAEIAKYMQEALEILQAITNNLPT